MVDRTASGYKAVGSKEDRLPLKEPDAPEESFALFDEASAYFLRSVKEYYTRDTAVEVMDALMPILGKDWRNRIMFGLVANKFNGVKTLRIYRDVTRPDKKIQAIKALRTITGLGLSEAKDVIDRSVQNPQSIKTVDPDHTRWSLAESERLMSENIADIISAGYRVEFL